MNTSAKDIGQYLETQAKLRSTVTYGEVVRKFPDLPPLGPNWRSHPLCQLFGELDDQDTANKRPFRTALVCAKETGIPGQGFFEAINTHRGRTVLKAEQDRVWIEEVTAVFAHYEDQH